MIVDLTADEVEAVLQSLDYSKDRVRSAPDTPHEIRRETLARLDAAAEKLRNASKSEATR